MKIGIWKIIMYNSFTIAPLPRFRDLLSTVLRKKKSDTDLARPWLKEGDRSAWLSRSAWSLQVIADWRMAITKQKISVWVPDFFCNTSLTPLRERGIDLFFYRVTDALEPDIEWCKQNANTSRPDLFLLVHYFGQTIPTLNTVSFCKNIGAWLIEDGAHVLQPLPGIGDAGDFVLYSPHKSLSIPDGALLIMRKYGPSQLKWDAVLNTIINNVITESKSTAKQTTVWLIKRILQKVGIRPVLQKNPIWPEVVEKNYSFPPARMSKFSKRLLSIQINTLDEVSAIRKQHLLYWNKVLHLTNTDFQYSLLQNTPYMACIIGHDTAATKKLYEQLQSKDFPLLTWPDLSPEVLAEPEIYSHALNLRRQRFYLPVHQTLKLSRNKLDR